MLCLFGFVMDFVKLFLRLSCVFVEVGGVVFLDLSFCSWCYYIYDVVEFLHDYCCYEVGIRIVVCCLNNLVVVEVLVEVVFCE